jgi:hypothetical protein
MVAKPRESRATGRPKGGSKPHGPEPLTEQVRLRLTAAQHARVVELAGVAGVTPAEWARARVEEAITRADHARQYVAHLEAMGGMPGATP